MLIVYLACARVGRGESFKIDSGVRQGCIMSPWLFTVNIDAEKKVKMGVTFLEERLPDLLYGDELFLCDESEEDLRAVVGRLVQVCSRRGLKVNAGGEEGLECEFCVDGMRLNHVSEFKYLGGLKMLLGLGLILGICMSHCSFLFLCMIVRGIRFGL